MINSVASRRRLLVAGLLVALTCAGVSALGAPLAQAAAPGSVTSYYPITVRQSDGTNAVIRKRPVRIVAVDVPAFMLDYLVALGVTPVGATLFSGSSVGPGTVYDRSGYPTWLSTEIRRSERRRGSAIRRVGAPGAPDLEAIAALRPDLIVNYNGDATRNLQQLKRIAPTVGAFRNTLPGTDVRSLGWYPALTNLGRILNLQARARRVVADFERAAASARKALRGKSATLVTYVGGANANLVLRRQQPIGAFFTYLGIVIPPVPARAQPIKGTGGTVGAISMENISDLRTRYLVLTGAFNTPGPKAFLANPLVQRLPAVRARRVIHTLPGYAFGSGAAQAGPLGQKAALRGIVRAFENPAATARTPSR